MAGKKKASIASGQSARFVNVAHQIGADEDEIAFKAKLAVIARQKPKEEPKSRGPQKREGRVLNGAAFNRLV